MADKKILTLDNLVTYNEKINSTYIKKSELKVKPEELLTSDDVIEVVKENSAPVDTMEINTVEIGTSGTYDVTSNTQIPTTRAVKIITDNLVSPISAKVATMQTNLDLKANTADVYSKTDANNTFAAKEAIPTATSQLTNDSGFLTEHQDISGKADKDHIHENYALVEHTHDIKTINGESLFGKGNLDLSSLSVKEIHNLYHSGRYEGQDLDQVQDEWIEMPTPKTSVNPLMLKDVAYGDGYYVAVGHEGTCWVWDTNTSTTTQWTKCALTSSNALLGIAYGKSCFKVVDGSGAIWTTTNPFSTWTKEASFSCSIVKIRFLNDTFYAVGTSGTILKLNPSTNKWSIVFQSSTVSQIDDITYGNGIYLVGGSDGFLACSSDEGQTWKTLSVTNLITKEAAYVKALHYANGCYFAATIVSPDFKTGGIYYSKDCNTWYKSEVSLSGITSFSGITSVGDRLFASSHGSSQTSHYSTIYESFDNGNTWQIINTTGFRILGAEAVPNGVIFVGDLGSNTSTPVWSNYSTLMLKLGSSWQEEAPTEGDYFYKTILTLSDGTELESNIVTHYVPKTTTYESKSAVKNGTDLSLVTTGEKYHWDMKQDAISAATKLPAAYVSDLATVATSGSYNDLTNKPTIPAKVSQLENDSNFVTKTDFEAAIGDINSVLDLILGEDN